MMTCLVALLWVLIIVGERAAQGQRPRRSVVFSDVKLKLFKEADFDGLSSLMVGDDVGRLFIGARGKVLALSLDDITIKTNEVKWTVSSADRGVCEMKGRSSEDCENYVRMLHPLDDGRMLACGTNAFSPACSYLTFKGGNLTMETAVQDGRGKVPFDPYQDFASMMDGNTLYSAASSNFLGTDMVFQRHGQNPIKTEAKRSWLNEPTMISINLAKLNQTTENREDDNVFLFFTETAVEERRSDLRLSRVARVCKSDVGGMRTLQRRWTSFLKARLDCPFGDAGSPSLVQDVFFLQDEDNWMESLFYATFTSNPEPSSTCSQSAVCAYKLSDVRQVFRGSFLTESDSGGWVTYAGAEPFIYPGSCINDEMRAGGVVSSLNLSDTTLLFVKHHPLMEGAVAPVTGRPLLVRSATQFSRIVVDKVTSLDGQQHHIMFIGTTAGWLQKGVWLNGEGGRIVEELQLFHDAQPIYFLQLSSRSGQLYGGARAAVVQLSVRDCSRYTSCHDCLLARDPYCGWDLLRGLCAAVGGASDASMVQSLADGDVGSCPNADCKSKIAHMRLFTHVYPSEESSRRISMVFLSSPTGQQPFTAVHLAAGVAQFLPCSPDTNLPVSWSFSGSVLQPGPRLVLLSQGLVVTPSSTDAGLYTCETVEEVKGREHRRTVVRYRVQVHDKSSRIQDVAVIVSAVCAGVGLMFLYRCCRQKVKNHVGCGNRWRDADMGGTEVTGGGGEGGALR
ncbi:semaphorin-4E isoform X2 [Fundulus heteroclitus]|nr:semaphorin-4E isoform X2 [Fundulus heteroclitus]